MLVVLFSELEKPESRDVECDCAPSVLDSSSEYRCRSSKLGTVRIVEFMRLGMRGDKEEAAGGGAAFPLAPPVVVRDMAELVVPSEARVKVDWGEGRSCEGVSALLGDGLVGVAAGTAAGGAAGAVSTRTTVTDERSWRFTVSSGCSIKCPEA
jgi:hypothetical protein